MLSILNQMNSSISKPVNDRSPLVLEGHSVYRILPKRALMRLDLLVTFWVKPKSDKTKIQTTRFEIQIFTTNRFSLNVLRRILLLRQDNTLRSFTFRRNHLHKIKSVMELAQINTVHSVKITEAGLHNLFSENIRNQNSNVSQIQL
jgi:hypothetical protein